MTIRTDVDDDVLLWEQADWLDEAVGWIKAQLGRLGLRTSGQVQQPHVRPWSTVLRVPTTTGDVWFKACMPALTHEVAVVEVLSSRRPDVLPELLAVVPTAAGCCRRTPEPASASCSRRRGTTSAGWRSCPATRGSRSTPSRSRASS
ncbi:MAG: hypothetical protein ACRDMU_01295 [Gaiellaceae bacterium]